MGLTRVLGVRALGLLGFELGVLCFEGVGDVLEEDQAEDDVLVLGRVHVVAQAIGHLPELGFKAEVCGGVVFVLSFSHGAVPYQKEVRDAATRQGVGAGGRRVPRFVVCPVTLQTSPGAPGGLSTVPRE
jgi:hypothetical protein